MQDRIHCAIWAQAIMLWHARPGGSIFRLLSCVACLSQPALIKVPALQQMDFSVLLPAAAIILIVPRAINLPWRGEGSDDEDEGPPPLQDSSDSGNEDNAPLQDASDSSDASSDDSLPTWSAVHQRASNHGWTFMVQPLDTRIHLRFMRDMELWMSANAASAHPADAGLRSNQNNAGGRLAGNDASNFRGSRCCSIL